VKDFFGGVVQIEGFDHALGDNSHVEENGGGFQ